MRYQKYSIHVHRLGGVFPAVWISSTTACPSFEIAVKSSLSSLISIPYDMDVSLSVRHLSAVWIHKKWLNKKCTFIMYNLQWKWYRRWVCNKYDHIRNLYFRKCYSIHTSFYEENSFTVSKGPKILPDLAKYIKYCLYIFILSSINTLLIVFLKGDMSCKYTCLKYCVWWLEVVLACVNSILSCFVLYKWKQKRIVRENKSTSDNRR